MTFDSTHGGEGEAIAVSRVVVRASERPDLPPETGIEFEESFDLLVFEEMPSRRHQLEMSRQVLEDLVAKAQEVLDGRG